MPTLPNPRHEKYAQGLAKGMTANAAYQEAGYTANRCNAGRLKTKEHITQRVSELQGRIAARAEITVESLIRDLAEARELAFKVGQPSAAVAATREVAILAGLRIEKRENRNVNLTDMDDAELAAIAASGREGIIAEEIGSAKPH